MSYILDALRRAEEREKRIANLHQLIREGEESGDPEPFDFEAFLKEMRENHKGAA